MLQPQPWLRALLVEASGILAMALGFSWLSGSRVKLGLSEQRRCGTKCVDTSTILLMDETKWRVVMNA